MNGGRIVATVNAAWNLVNFRAGLLRALIADGWEVVAVAPDDPEPRARLEAMGCRFVPIAIESKSTSLRADLAILGAYRAILRRERPQVMLGWTIKPNVYGSLAARRLRIPTVNNISGLGTGFMRAGWLNRVVRLLYRRGLAGSRRVFFQNADDRNLFVSLKLVRPAQTALLPGSGIDLDHFVPMPPTGRGSDELVFLLIARMLGDKGVREFVAAARAVRQRHPAVRFRLLGFMGVDNRTAIPAAEVEGWVAEGVVEYHPPVPDVRPAVADADVVVLPSYREGTSRVLLEAAAMARPLIATDVPGCREVVADGVNGFLCRVADAQSLAEAIERMIAVGPEQRAAMAAAGRAKVAAEFDERLVIDAYRREIAAVLA